MTLWGWTARPYDRGYAPAVAAGRTFVVEVHQADDTGPVALWARLGRLGFAVEWVQVFQYDFGYRPAVAATPDGAVVTVDEGPGDNLGRTVLRCRVGRVQDLPAPTRLSLAQSTPYTAGTRPAIALLGGDPPTAVEVHEGDGGDLWSIVGPVVGATVEWGSPQHYATGFAPAVAVGPNGEVVAVHQQLTQPLPTPLLAVAGRVDRESLQIDWWVPHEYTKGLRPAISVDWGRPRFVEVHQAHPSDPSALWWQDATYESLLDLTWHGEAVQYDYGARPRVCRTRDSLVEVHESGDGTLWYTGGVPLQ